MKLSAVFITLCLITGIARAQDIKAYSAADIKAFASSPDTVYVFNFWATWCQPCVQELPEFNELYRNYIDKPVKILMISLDFKTDYPYKIQGYLKRKPLSPEVGWLAETDPNVFIPQIENSWEGSIPATLVVRPFKGKNFMEGQVSYRKLSRAVDDLIKK